MTPPRPTNHSRSLVLRISAGIIHFKTIFYQGLVSVFIAPILDSKLIKKLRSAQATPSLVIPEIGPRVEGLNMVIELITESIPWPGFQVKEQSEFIELALGGELGQQDCEI
jgi:hypothetical protein